MKKRLAPLALAVLTLTATIPTAAFAIPRETREQLLETTLLTTLQEPIRKAVNEHYKHNPPRFYLHDSQILHLSRNTGGSDTYTVRVQILIMDDKTRQPQTRDILTLRVEPTNSKVISYESHPVKTGSHA